MKVQDFKDVTPFRLANSYKRLEGSYCHNFEAQGIQAEVGNWAASS